MAPSFTIFTCLPLELRQLIWHLALPDDEPEVLVLRAEQVGRRNQDKALMPMTVDTGFPVLMHTCRESRDYARHHSGIHFRFSQEACCEVPFRLFRPDLDTVFWDEDQHHCLWAPSYTADHDRWLSELRHLALPSPTALLGQHLAECILQHCPQLRTLSVVFADSGNHNWVQTRFAAPARRHRLRRIEPGHARRMKIVYDTWQYDSAFQITVHEFLMIFRNELNDHGTLVGNHHECAGQAWSLDPSANLQCFAQTFVEWRHRGWVEARVEKRHREA
ncbi:hypothetical protein VTI28DRAFT_4900 [Corynascus sepedonium]